MDNEEKQKYQLRLKQIRAKLSEIGVKEAMYYFTKKYPDYAWGEKRKGKKFNRIDNLWHGKIIDNLFLSQMEAFLTFKEDEFE